MIVEFLFRSVIDLITFLTNNWDIPELPAPMYELFDTVLSYINQGLGILSLYCDLPYLLLLFSFVFLMDVYLRAYYMMIWLLKKIPILGIE